MMTRRANGPGRTALLLTFLSAFATGVAAQQQQVPSDDELRCMYCIEVIRAEIDLQHHMISAADDAAGSSEAPAMREQWIKTSAELLQGLANLEGVLYRLQSYMLPRIPALDSLALAAAIREGDADFQESKLIANRCAVECTAPHVTDESSHACSSSCGNDALLTKVTACQNPTWLPR
jgi:hypothetical protein